MKQKNLENLMILYKKMKIYTEDNIQWMNNDISMGYSSGYCQYTADKINKALNVLNFKNYIELCEFLDEPVYEGIKKEIQLLEWKKYFSWVQYGYSYRITEVFDVDDYEFEFEQDDENWFDWWEIFCDNLDVDEMNNKNRIKLIEDNSY